MLMEIYYIHVIRLGYFIFASGIYSFHFLAKNKHSRILFDFSLPETKRKNWLGLQLGDERKTILLHNKNLAEREMKYAHPNNSMKILVCVRFTGNVTVFFLYIYFDYYWACSMRWTVMLTSRRQLNQTWTTVDFFFTSNVLLVCIFGFPPMRSPRRYTRTHAQNTLGTRVDKSVHTKSEVLTYT